MEKESAEMEEESAESQKPPSVVPRLSLRACTYRELDTLGSRSTAALPGWPDQRGVFDPIR
jgi:hypothetical protein